MEIFLPSVSRERLTQAEAVGQSFSQAFADFYRKALPRWESGEEKRPMMVEDLPALNPWKKKASEQSDKIFLLLDGMRWDLWEYLKESFLKPMAHQVRIVQEGVLWAHLPSSTPRQMEMLTEASERTGPGGRKWLDNLWKVGGVDERVHTEKGTLEYLFRNALQYLQLDLAPRLVELPPRTLILFFSDHGFVENPQFEKGDKYRSSRYAHGEASPFEVIVPWAAAVRI